MEGIGFDNGMEMWSRVDKATEPCGVVAMANNQLGKSVGV